MKAKKSICLCLQRFQTLFCKGREIITNLPPGYFKIKGNSRDEKIEKKILNTIGCKMSHHYYHGINHTCILQTLHNSV